jgi:adenosylcobinamide-GDP ribazoletransferase
MRGLRDAVAFLTRLPVGARGALTDQRLARAAAWFPVVGLAVGAAVGGVRLLADLALPAGPSTILALGAGILMTGALHEDGLADTVDGLGAHVSRHQRLEILRDPRVGTYGALALIGSALLATSLLASVDATHCLRAALTGHVLGRWSVLPQSRLLPPARADGVAAHLRVTGPGLVGATAVACTTAIVAGGPTAGAAALGAAMLVTLVVGRMVLGAIGGVTGDTYGATTKLVELTTYVMLVAAWS